MVSRKRSLRGGRTQGKAGKLARAVGSRPFLRCDSWSSRARGPRRALSSSLQALICEPARALSSSPTEPTEGRDAEWRGIWRGPTGCRTD